MRPSAGLAANDAPAIPRVYWVCVVTAAAVYLLLAIHQPYSIMVWQGFDDMLFIEHGQSIAQGHWLGRFSELTLIKGPGYPLFLAANYWLGLPISLTQALFHCSALGALSLLVLRMSGSQALAIVTFVLPLLDPRVNADNRIIRDGIYAGQAIWILALFAYAILLARSRRARRVAAGCAGLLTGWFWLTREEGIWLIPGLVFIALFAALRRRRDAEQAPPVEPSLIAIACGAIVYLAIGTANFVVYKTFTGVDVGEKNFRSALTAMESVRLGDRVPYVAVPRHVRAALYEVSPSFAELKRAIDPADAVSPFASAGCPYHPITCGDISNGFFFWALRSAAGKAGYFESPKKASQFFRRMATEITAACQSGRLTCATSAVDLIPFMPPMTDEQVRGIPQSLANVWRSVAASGHAGKTSPWKITGPENAFEGAVAFLNFPAHFPIAGKPADVELQGWYYRKGKADEWFDIAVADATGKDLPFELARVQSPDLAQTFGDALASRQRFRIRSRCADHCQITFSHAGLTRFVVPLGTSQKYFFQDGATLAFDLIDAGSRPDVTADIRTQLAQSVAEILDKVYSSLLPPLLVSGLLAFAAAAVLAFRSSHYPQILALAGACWIAIAARTVILVLVDVSSFSAVTVNYLQPIFALSLVAAVFSLFGLRKMTVLRTQGPGGRS